MAMRKWSVIEDELKKAHIHPNLLRYLGEVHERAREQHQQIMAVVEFVDKNVDLMNAMMASFGAVDKRLEKMGIKPQVEEIEGDPDEQGSTYHTMRDEPGKKD